MLTMKKKADEEGECDDKSDTASLVWTPAKETKGAIDEEEGRRRRQCSCKGDTARPARMHVNKTKRYELNGKPGKREVCKARMRRIQVNKEARKDGINRMQKIQEG